MAAPVCRASCASFYTSVSVLLLASMQLALQACQALTLFRGYESDSLQDSVLFDVVIIEFQNAC